MRIGVDWGGTKIEAAAFDGDGRQLWRQRVPTPRDDYAASIRTTVELIERLERETNASGTVGVGIPGVVDPHTGLVKNANSTWLIGKPFHADLAATLGRDVRCANDANCLALSEAVDGAGAGKRVVFAAILGTGCGGGIAVDARLLEGVHAVAGEWGHNPLPWPQAGEYPGPHCYCGRRGCIETWISGTAYHVTEPSSELYHDRIARAFAHVVNFIDPDVIVVGGGMSNVLDYETLQRVTGTYVFGGGGRTPIVPAAHGDSSGVRGAAWLWPEIR